MSKGYINGAKKLLTDNMSGGILPLDDKTLDLLIQKHPEPRNISDDVLLQGPIQQIHPTMFNAIDTKGGSGPSGIDADGWKKILVSKVYGDMGEYLRKAFSKFIIKTCTTDITDSSLEAYIACRLVPLDKNPGLRPTGVGEILRRIAGKIIMKIVRENVMDSSSKIQM